LAIVDFAVWQKNKEIQINKLKLVSGVVNVFVDSLGNANYNIYHTSPDTVRVQKDDPDEDESIPVNINGISMKNTNISYVDHDGELYSDLQNFDAEMNISMVGDIISSDIQVHNSIVSFAYADERRYVNKAGTATLCRNLQASSTVCCFQQTTRTT
jgi:AsmA protein